VIAPEAARAVQRINSSARIERISFAMTLRHDRARTLGSGRTPGADLETCFRLTTVRGDHRVASPGE
jgi:hypothetical protein